MNKKIFKQIKNEWRSNLWLYMELFLVSIVMWFIVDFLYVQISKYNEPLGFDISHCYLIEAGKLTEKSALFQPNDSVPSAHLDELCDRLEHDPAIEAVGLSQNAYPYNGSNSESTASCGSIKTVRPVIHRYVTPSFFKVFKYRGINGETPDELASKLQDNTVFVSDNVFGENLKKGAKTIIGKQISLNGDTVNTYRLAASIQPVKYSDFSDLFYSSSIVSYLPRDWRWLGIEICVRVRPEYDVDFAKNFLKDSPKKYNIGNFYISNVKPFDKIRKFYTSDEMRTYEMFIWGMSFLLVNVFFGLLGTFWFRTQQRRGEIALLKSLGCTKNGVYARLICEGVIILVLATIPAIIIDYNLANADITNHYMGETFGAIRFSFSVIVSFILILLMMIIGISIPARKAMKIDPADALHEE